MTAQNLEFSFSRHGHPFMDTPRLVRQNLSLSLGFGMAVFLILLVPFFNFIFVPVAVIAGTRLFLDLKGAGAVGAKSERL